MAHHLCTECAEHFGEVQTCLENAGILFEIAPRLVRGLDYYVRTAFEIVSGELGAQNALVGGGRYDGLSEVLGGPPVQAIGFALGLDRLTMILPQHQRDSGNWKPELFLAYKGDAAFKKALNIARELRNKHRTCYLDFSGGSLKSQMRLANKIDAAHVLIIGEEELTNNRYTIKKMDDSSQWEVTLPELTSYLQSFDASGISR